MESESIDTFDPNTAQLDAAPTASAGKSWIGSRLVQGYWRRLGGRAQSRVAALLDQGLMSVSTLAQSIVFVRIMPVTQFGEYATFLSIGLIAVALQKTMLVTPMIIHSGKQELVIPEWRRYSELIAISFGAGLAIIGLGLHLARPSSFATVALLSSLGVIPYILCEFQRRQFILRQKFASMIANSVIFLVCSVLAVVVVVCLKGGFLTAAIAATIGYWVAFAASRRLDKSRGEPRSATRSVDLVRRHWHVIWWSTVAVLPYMVFNNGMPVIVSALLGSSAVGFFSSSRVFLSPVTMLIQAIDNVDKPAAGRALRSSGVGAMVRSLAGTMLTIGGIGVPYLLLVCVFPKDAMTFVLGAHYRGSEELVYGWMVVGFVMVIGQPIESALLLLGKVRVYFVSRLIAAVLAIGILVAGLPLDRAVIAVFAAAAAWLAALLITAISTTIVVRKARRASPAAS